MKRKASELGYSVERDLEIVVEGEAVLVHSFTLMMASPVFRQMLQSGLKESREGRVVLEGKSLCEFKTVLPFIEVAGGAEPPPVTQESVLILLKWADEYQIEALTRRCEQFLLKTADAASPDSLDTASAFKLHELLDKCIAAYSKDILPRLTHLSKFLDNDEVMNRLWPVIVKNISPESNCEVPYSLSSMWSLLAKGAQTLHIVKQLSFSSVHEVSEYVRMAKQGHNEAMVLCIPDAEEVIRLCKRCAPGATSTAKASEEKISWIRKVAGKALTIHSMSMQFNVVCRLVGSSENHTLPYDALLRPLWKRQILRKRRNGSRQ